MIVTICLLVIFGLCIIGCIIYKIWLCKKNEKEQEEYDLKKANAPMKKYKKIFRNTKKKPTTSLQPYPREQQDPLLAPDREKVPEVKEENEWFWIFLII